jgi:hypothetical protein
MTIYLKATDALHLILIIIYKNFKIKIAYYNYLTVINNLGILSLNKEWIFSQKIKNISINSYKI